MVPQPPPSGAPRECGAALLAALQRTLYQHAHREQKEQAHKERRREEEEAADSEAESEGARSFVTACSDTQRPPSFPPQRCQPSQANTPVPFRGEGPGEAEDTQCSSTAKTRKETGDRENLSPDRSPTVTSAQQKNRSEPATEQRNSLDEDDGAFCCFRPCRPSDIPPRPQEAVIRRTQLPCEKPSSNSLSVFKILKQVNGSDMRNFSLPISVNEPLSMLQRICEDFEYARILSVARTRPTSTERLAYVTVFALSAYAGSMDRCYKPFNPMLGETYEMSHRGINYIGEQVSHHPPVSAYHAAAHNGDFVCFGTGTHVESCNSGRVTLRLFLPGGVFEDYTWSRPNTKVHNIIFGTMWMEWVGEVRVTNHSTHEVAEVSFLPATSAPSATTGNSWMPFRSAAASSSPRHATARPVSSEPQTGGRSSSRDGCTNACERACEVGVSGGITAGDTTGPGQRQSFKDGTSRPASAAPCSHTQRGRLGRRSDSWLSKECQGSNGLRGEVLDTTGVPRYYIDGCWSRRLWMTKIGKRSYRDLRERRGIVADQAGRRERQADAYHSSSSGSSSGARRGSLSRWRSWSSQRSDRVANEGAARRLEMRCTGESASAAAQTTCSQRLPAPLGCDRNLSQGSSQSGQRDGTQCAEEWMEDDTLFVVWEPTRKPPHAPLYYNMPAFAMELNELTRDYLPDPVTGRGGAAPTDCRMRPDLRKYEEGDSTAAQAEKVRLEEKQRSAARQMKDGEESWKPLWFERKVNVVTGEEDWLYNGQYWPHRNKVAGGKGRTGGRAGFSSCPEIY
ncbi:oxysterol-binding protein [Cystoisospora suis]|uniref:Oxysterol-binding protein n=1 Tax=Cystoisospora suis TaxID=483139 RepID=A0A2C6KU24_9APIC|nr:oxysterol-binding protein [Cystoisospora suis]